MYAEVVLTRHIGKSLTYLIPDNLISSIQVGQAVKVPLNRSEDFGYVLRIFEEFSSKFKLKKILSIEENNPFFSTKTVELIEWMSAYYALPISNLISSILPAGNKNNKINFESNAEAANYTISNNYQLNKAQEKAFNEILNSHKPTLLHGVTGSGKTLIYLKLADYFLKQNKSTLILVPEIGLTFALANRAKAIFGDNIAMLHSGLTLKQRRETWKSIYKEEKKIVIGTRSAIFAPIKNAGIIIIDEEQDSSYKQENSPRYNAKTIAFMRSKLENFQLLLSSATPSLNTMFLAKKGVFNLTVLASRFGKAQMPNIKLIDLTKAAKVSGKLLTNELISAISTTLKKKEQIILLFNQRGTAKSLRCEACGQAIMCPRCAVSFTQHTDSLKCHYCGASQNINPTCPNCGSKELKPIGQGIQKLQTEIKKTFGQAKILRLDSDISKKNNQKEKILHEFSNQEADILLGTQMIAKGHDFPNVTLVGVVDIDSGLYFPDIFSAEKTYDLLVQVIGRAGRSEKKGSVLIQTYNPLNQVIQAAIHQDFNKFYQKELYLRQEVGLPPLIKIIKIRLEGKDENLIINETNKLQKSLSLEFKDLELSEPCPAMINRIKNKYRWQFFIKFSPEYNTKNLKLFLLNNHLRNNKKISFIIDIDPLSMI